MREGNLEAPKREPLDWQSDAFTDKDSVYAELERVFDICQDDYTKFVDQCFLCDLCAETKCPYLPPHEWAVDFSHLMLRAKAQRFKGGDTKWRDRVITSTDPLFDSLSRPGIAQAANAANAAEVPHKTRQSLLEDLDS